MENGWKV